MKIQKKESLSFIHSIANDLDALIKKSKNNYIELSNHYSYRFSDYQEYLNSGEEKNVYNDKLNKHVDSFEESMNECIAYIEQLVELKFYFRLLIDNANKDSGISTLMNQRNKIESLKDNSYGVFDYLTASTRRFTSFNKLDSDVKSLHIKSSHYQDSIKEADLLNRDLPIMVCSFNDDYLKSIKSKNEGFEKDLKVIKNKIASINSSFKINFEIDEQIAKDLAIE